MFFYFSTSTRRARNGERIFFFGIQRDLRIVRRHFFPYLNSTSKDHVRLRTRGDKEKVARIGRVRPIRSLTRVNLPFNDMFNSRVSYRRVITTSHYRGSYRGPFYGFRLRPFCGSTSVPIFSRLNRCTVTNGSSYRPQRMARQGDDRSSKITRTNRKRRGAYNRSRSNRSNSLPKDSTLSREGLLHTSRICSRHLQRGTFSRPTELRGYLVFQQITSRCFPRSRVDRSIRCQASQASRSRRPTRVQNVPFSQHPRVVNVRTIREGHNLQGIMRRVLS